MKKGATADFEWSANGAVLNHDTHGDGKGQNISYKKGRAIPGQADKLTAAFTGNHGWFWRNRTDDEVVLTLRTRGDYEKTVVTLINQISLIFCSTALLARYKRSGIMNMQGKK